VTIDMPPCFSLSKPERIQAGEAVKYFGDSTEQ